MVQSSALCRSRRELSNEYLLAKIGVDTAENEPLEVWGKIIQYYSIVSLVAPRKIEVSSWVQVGLEHDRIRTRSRQRQVGVLVACSQLLRDTFAELDERRLKRLKLLEINERKRPRILCWPVMHEAKDDVCGQFHRCLHLLYIMSSEDDVVVTVIPAVTCKDTSE